ncbi:MAG TPA: GyrI-like domain-containing protein [Polyangia bacterium]|jgi:hypothetical protein
MAAPRKPEKPAPTPEKRPARGADPKAEKKPAARAATLPPHAPPRPLRKPEKKLDLVRSFKAEYSAGRDPMLLVIQPAAYLTVTGKGEPGGDEFQARLGVLYGAAFTIKSVQQEAGRDFKVAPLEGQYWGKGDVFKVAAAADWNWKLMVRVPEFVTRSDLKRALESLTKKGRDPAEAGVKLERLHEGECVQALHIGSYATEPETIERMDAFARERGLALKGRHHEIYLSDPRKVPPTKIRTILRYPVQDA